MNIFAPIISGVVQSGSVCRCSVRHLLTRKTKTWLTLRSLIAAGQRLYSRYEPDNLDDGPEIPEYEALTIQMRSYDFVKLEAYSKYVHRLTNERFDLDTENYAVPARTSKIQTFKPNSSILQNEYDLALYERVVQIRDVPSTKVPLLFEILHQHLPSGVNLSIKEPDPSEEEFRYLPDREIDELKVQLDAITKARDDRRKK